MTQKQRDKRIDQLYQFLNMTSKSGWVDPVPVIVELTKLHGLDVKKVVIGQQ